MPVQQIVTPFGTISTKKNINPISKAGNRVERFF
jgi:hypothetical protein